MRLKVKCDYCGKEFMMLRSQYIKSDSHFCNHICQGKHKSDENFKKSLGKKYGELIVIENLGIDPKYGTLKVKAVCSCGEERICLLSSLKKGDITMCYASKKKARKHKRLY